MRYCHSHEREYADILFPFPFHKKLGCHSHETDIYIYMEMECILKVRLPRHMSDEDGVYFIKRNKSILPPELIAKSKNTLNSKTGYLTTLNFQNRAFDPPPPRLFEAVLLR